MKRKITLTILFGLVAVLIIVYSKTFSTILTVDETSNYVIWDGVTVASSFSAGDGSEDHPYQISNGAELMYFKSLIEGDDSSNYNKKHYILTDNINLNNNSFSAIGTPISNRDNTLNHNIFKGNFDGNGYSIANGNITEKLTSDNEYYMGFFVMVEDATIKNLNLKNFTLLLNRKESYQNIYVGTLVGSSLSNYKTELYNVGIYDTSINITGQSNIGGVIGYQDHNTFLKAIYVNTSIISGASSLIGNMVGYSVTADQYNIENSVIFNNNHTNIYGYAGLESYNEVYSYTYVNSNADISKYEKSLVSTDKTLLDLSLILTSSIDGEFTWKIDREYLRFDNKSNIEKLTQYKRDSTDYNTFKVHTK